MSRITIKDIARALNLHHSTVSRALRNDKRVKEKTRKLVVNYARENGYQINMSALHLRGSVKNVIAVIVPNINHNFFSNIVSLVTNKAVKQGYIVSVFQSNESVEQEREIINTVIQNNVAGVIASVTMETKNSDHFFQLRQFNIPLVFFDRVCPDVPVPMVMVNNSSIVASAVEMMVRKGCKRIAHVSGLQHVNVFSERHEGYLKALQKHRLKYERSIFIDKAFTIEDGRMAVTELFNGTDAPDGIVCDSNNLLIGALIELKNKRLKVPEDISVIGFADNPYVEAFNPGVISIVQPDEEIADKAFALLMNMLYNKPSSHSVVYRLDARILYNYSYEN